MSVVPVCWPLRLHSVCPWRTSRTSGPDLATAPTSAVRRVVGAAGDAVADLLLAEAGVAVDRLDVALKVADQILVVGAGDRLAAEIALDHSHWSPLSVKRRSMASIFSSRRTWR